VWEVRVDQIFIDMIFPDLILQSFLDLLAISFHGTLLQMEDILYIEYIVIRR